MARSRSAVYMNVRWLERLKPPKEGREEHFDEEVRGLELRLSSERMSWFVFLSHPGRLQDFPFIRRLILTIPCLLGGCPRSGSRFLS